MRKLFDLRLPFFAPLWKRALTVGITAGWGLLELLWGNPGWAILFGCLAAYCTYEFFVVFDPDNYTDDET